MRSIALRAALVALGLALVAAAAVRSAPAPRAYAAAGSWTGVYYNNMSLSGTAVLTRDDGPNLDFTWTGSPGGSVNGDQWSARWTKTDTLSAGTYHFAATSDDGVRVYVDGTKIIDAWKDQPATSYSADYAITAGSHTLVYEFYDNCCDAVAKLTYSAAAPPPPSSATWQGSYFNNMTLSGTAALTRDDGANLDFTWPGAPGQGVNADQWSARWTKTDTFAAGTYRFTATSDDSVRVYVDGTKIIDAWVDQPATTYTADKALAAGSHTIRFEFYDNCCDAVARLTMQNLSDLSGFVTDTIVGGLNLPTVFAMSPDGRIFIGLKSGTIKVLSGGVLKTFYTVSPVNDFHDRGLLGIALDPNFPATPYVYVSYTYDNNPSDIAGPKTVQVIRLTATGDTGGGKLVLLGSVTGSPSQPSCENFATTADCIASDSDTHTVGNLKFGPDGMLYVATGDGADAGSVDPLALRAQDINRLNGKILRVNPANGRGLADNPFYNGDLTATRAKVWARGVRNDFRFNFRPGTNTIISGDVGWDTWEEVNAITSGANLGWPCYEGNPQQPGYAAFSTCQSLYNAGGVTQARYSYNHSGQSAAVAGGAFTGANSYPPAYQNTYWFGDYARNQIFTAHFDAANNLSGSVSTFSNGADGPVDFEIGPADGDVYYLAINAGELRHIRYLNGNRPPTAVASGNPTAGVAPLTVNFSSAGSSDPDAGQAITYDWNFGDGSAHSSQPNPSHQYTTTGNYTATLTVTDPFGATGTATVPIQVGNTPPVATIGAPADGSHFNITDTITFSGSALDAQDGALTGARLAWTITLYHCSDLTFTSCHTHPYFSTTGSGGSFVAADHGDFVYYVIQLVATDSGGLTDTKAVTVTPNRTTLSFDADRAGVQLTVDGTAQTVPFTRSVPVKSQHVIFAPDQVVGGTSLTFASWSDGGAQQHTVLADAAKSFTAHYVTTPTPTATNTAVAPTATNTPAPSANWTGRYYNNKTLSKTIVLTRNDGPNLNFTWSGSPGPNVKADQWSARWTKTDTFGAGTYHFVATADDGVRVYVDGVKIIDGWKDQAATTYTADVAIAAGAHALTYEFYDNCCDAVAKLTYALAGPTPTPTNTPPPSPSWNGAYYNNMTLSGSPALTRNDGATLDFLWPDSPGGSVNGDQWSARWTRTDTFSAGTYRFTATADDGVRVYVDGTKIIDAWIDQPATTYSADFALAAGSHTLTYEFYDNCCDAVARLTVQQLP